MKKKLNKKTLFKLVGMEACSDVDKTHNKPV
jgi:hypothetical protein